MPLTAGQQKIIEEIIGKCLRDKFKNYDPESKHKPCHYRLPGKDCRVLHRIPPLRCLPYAVGQKVLFEQLAGHFYHCCLSLKNAFSPHSQSSKIIHSPHLGLRAVQV